MYTYARNAVVRAWSTRTATCRAPEGERGRCYDGSGLARGVSRRIGRSAKVRLWAKVPDPHTNSQDVFAGGLLPSDKHANRPRGEHDARPPIDSRRRLSTEMPISA